MDVGLSDNVLNAQDDGLISIISISDGWRL
jgi:hypothetical protein